MTFFIPKLLITHLRFRPHVISYIPKTTREFFHNLYTYSYLSIHVYALEKYRANSSAITHCGRVLYRASNVSFIIPNSCRSPSMCNSFNPLLSVPACTRQTIRSLAQTSQFSHPRHEICCRGIIARGPAVAYRN